MWCLARSIQVKVEHHGLEGAPAIVAKIVYAPNQPQQIPGQEGEEEEGEEEEGEAEVEEEEEEHV